MLSISHLYKELHFMFSDPERFEAQHGSIILNLEV